MSDNLRSFSEGKQISLDKSTCTAVVINKPDSLRMSTILFVLSCTGLVFYGTMYDEWMFQYMNILVIGTTSLVIIFWNKKDWTAFCASIILCLAFVNFISHSYYNYQSSLSISHPSTLQEDLADRAINILESNSRVQEYIGAPVEQCAGYSFQYSNINSSPSFLTFTLPVTGSHVKYGYVRGQIAHNNNQILIMSLSLSDLVTDSHIALIEPSINVNGPVKPKDYIALELILNDFQENAMVDLSKILDLLDTDLHNSHYYITYYRSKALNDYLSISIEYTQGIPSFNVEYNEGTGHSGTLLFRTQQNLNRDLVTELLHLYASGSDSFKSLYSWQKVQ